MTANATTRTSWGVWFDDEQRFKSVLLAVMIGWRFIVVIVSLILFGKIMRLVHVFLGDGQDSESPIESPSSTIVYFAVLACALLAVRHCWLLARYERKGVPCIFGIFVIATIAWIAIALEMVFTRSPLKEGHAEFGLAASLLFCLVLTEMLLLLLFYLGHAYVVAYFLRNRAKFT